jgi:hypothetical protein|tara:strand:- start:1575 stop:1901 length:327 start_codon:yes stop_codon:yes gene_type:complete
MANTFKKDILDVTSSETTIYTAPASTQVVLMSLRITNVNASTADAITANIVESGGANVHIASTINVPSDSTLELIEQKIVLEAGDVLKLKGNQSSGYLEAIASVLEIS